MNKFHTRKFQVMPRIVILYVICFLYCSFYAVLYSLFSTTIDICLQITYIDFYNIWQSAHPRIFTMQQGNMTFSRSQLILNVAADAESCFLLTVAG